MSEPAQVSRPQPRFLPAFFLGPAVLAAANLALFWRFLSPATHRVLSEAGEDLTGQFFWWRQFGFDQLKQGHLALWNPHLFCGEPFFGGFQSALLYPPNWLFMVLPLTFAVNLSIALHVFLAGLFAFFWAQGRGAHPASALAAAFLYMWGGAYFLHVVPGHLSNLCSMAWIPLVFLAVDRLRGKGWGASLPLGMAAFSMQVFAGHIQYAYYTVLAVGLYALLDWNRTPRKLSFWGGLAVMGLGAGLLAAIQLLAGWNAAGESFRFQRLSLDFIDAADMTPERLCCLLMPGFFGGMGDYWGGGIYWEGAVFVSVTAFGLALFALFISDHPQKKTFGWMALFLTLLAVGKRTPLFAFFYRYVPLFDHFRGIGKMNILITLCLAALAVMGMDEIFRNPSCLHRLQKAAAWAAPVFLLPALALWLGSPPGKWLGKSGEQASPMAFSFLACGLKVAFFSFLAWAGRKKELFRYGFPLLAAMELCLFAGGNLPSFDDAALVARAAQIRQVYSADPGDYRVLAEPSNTTLGARGLDIWGEDPAVPFRYAAFAAASQETTTDRDILRKSFFNRFPPSLGLLRLRYLFHDEGGRLIPQRTGLKEVPRVFLVRRFEVLPREAILPRTLSPGFRPGKEVLLESDPGLPPATASPASGEAVCKDLSTDEVEIEARVRKPALLVLSDNYSRGWNALAFPDSNQGRYRVLPANGFQMAVPLGAGAHHFLLRYRPTAFVVGKWVSLFSWLAFLGWLAFQGLKVKWNRNARGNAG